MNILTRIKSALRAFKTDEAPSIFNFTHAHAQSGLLERRADKTELLSAYASWVYACVNVRARTAAAARFRVYRAKGADEYEELSSHPLIALLEKPNPFETRADILTKTVIQLDLTGDCFWYVPRNRLGFPAEIWILPVERMSIIPHPKKVIGGYELRGAQPVHFEPEEIVHFKYPNPRDFFYGISPLSAAALAVDIDTFQHTFQRNFYRHSASPPIALKTDKKLDDKSFLRLKADWEKRFRGAENYGKIAVLEQGLGVERIGVAPRDLDWLASNRAARDVILAVFGVPASKLGLTDDANRSVAQENDYTFATNVIEPILALIEERITLGIANRFGANVIVRHDPIAKDDAERRARAAEIRLRSGLTTINEERAVEGFAPVSGGDVPRVAAGTIPLTDSLTQQPPA